MRITAQRSGIIGRAYRLSPWPTDPREYALKLAIGTALTFDAPMAISLVYELPIVESIRS